ncbi:hypothetical protein HPP92_008759 [Vanilla planifolia]|uniref:Uncharacterized protein n=1 Tax=Vanilla planifolia TaxID=51239 RepID=A0A835R900_VANPL|nr:hypothetical protein HPP92_008759 [Vanilla planifolia]
MFMVWLGDKFAEFDALTGCKISSIKIGARVVQMQYIPNGGHAIVSVLEDSTIRSCDFDSEQTLVLHSPEKKSERISSETDVHLAMTPLQPVAFFGFHRRMSVTVVGTVEGGRPPTKIKTDLKKPIVNLYCHPRLPVLYVAYADGLIRAYNIQTYAVHYTLQLDSTIKLLGASSFAFHPTLEWIFVGDRRGSLLAWDVSTDRPSMIGITQVGSHPITSISWLPTIELLVTVSKDGAIHVWKMRVVNPNRVQATFFEHAGWRGSIPTSTNKKFSSPFKAQFVSLAICGYGRVGESQNRTAYTREGRKQLFSVLQSAKGSSASILKEKLLALGSSGILAEHQLQTHLQEHHLKGQSQLTISDIARKAFLHSHFMEGHAQSGPISRLPILAVLDVNHQLRDAPVCKPLHLELNFFNRENHVLQYPVRAFYMDNFNLMAHSLSSGTDNIYKKLYSSIPGHIECLPVNMLYSSKQHLFLVVFELSGPSGAIHEVVLYWEQMQVQSRFDKLIFCLATLCLCYLVLTHNVLPQVEMQHLKKKNVATDNGAMQFQFESEVDRIFSFPLDGTVLYAISGKHVGLVKIILEYHLATDNGYIISTKTDGKFMKLQRYETVYQQHFQQKIDLPEVLYQITSRFDSLRITPRSLDILANGSPVCGDLALSLSQAGPQFTQVLRCTYAIKALRFSTALSVLKDEYMRSRYYPQCPPTSHLFHRFQQLAHSCIMYGQFDSAKETYEIISDFESMLDLFICHLNPTAMRRLAEMLEDAATDSELRRYSERILIVRSTGWSQAGAFDNFAAESMVPKGPEWGGGNWEIKTPINMKNIPQWELAGEVMPYMKTDDGGVPSIIADHIGVYLGAVKGRGNVVEVNEKSLVKAFTATSHENNGLAASAAISIQTYTGMTDDLKVGSLKENNGKQLSGGVASGGEQEKAEEEFKRSLYGVVGGSSSDEDEASSKIKKLHIKIRDKTVSGSAVDVNKLKEATKQFKIGDAPMRTRSISSRGSRDISLVLPMPAPAMTTAATTSIASSASDMFKPDGSTSAMQTRTILGGMGVAAGPIPENFFENTISAVNVAASLVTPRTYLSKLDQSSQGTEDEKIPPKQNCPSNIDPYDVGMLPQLPQQRGILLSELVCLIVQSQHMSRFILLRFQLLKLLTAALLKLITPMQ